MNKKLGAKDFRLALVLSALFLASSGGRCFAQNNFFDSLKTAVRNSGNDTSRCSALTVLIENIAGLNPDTALTLSQEIEKICDKNLEQKNLGDKSRKTFLRHKSYALNNYGFLFERKGEMQKAMDSYQQSIKVAQLSGDKAVLGNAFNGIAVMNDNQGNFPKALEYHAHALKYRELAGDKDMIAETMNNLGFIYQEVGDFESSRNYYNKALEIHRATGDKSRQAITLTNIAGIYRSMGNLEEAIRLCEEALALRLQLNDTWAISNSYNNLAAFYSRKDKDKALEYYLKSLELARRVNHKTAICNALNNCTGIYIEKNNLPLAKKFALEASELSKNLGSPRLISSSAKNMFEICMKEGNYKSAVESFRLHVDMRDSTKSAENKKASIKAQLRYEFDKKAAADSIKNIEERRVRDALFLAQSSQLKQQRMQFWFVAGGLILVAAALLLLVNRFRITRRQKSIIEQQKKQVDMAFLKLEEKNTEIIDSIYYARRIQRALMTSEMNFHKMMRRLRS